MIPMKRLLLSMAVLTVSLLGFASLANAQWTPLNPVKSFQNASDGIEFKMDSGTLKLLVCSESIIRVLYSPTNSFPNRSDYIIIKKDWPATPWKIDSSEK